MKKYSILIEGYDFVVEANNEEQAIKEALYLYKEAKNLLVSVREIVERDELPKNIQEEIKEKGHCVICDNTNNSEEDIANRRINVTIYTDYLGG